MGIGERIKTARKRKNMTQAALAEKIGVHEVTVRKWEITDGNPHSSVILPLALALGASTAYLTCETDDPAPVGLVGDLIAANASAEAFLNKGVPLPLQDDEDAVIEETDVMREAAAMLMKNSPGAERFRSRKNAAVISLPLYDVRVCAGLGAADAGEAPEKKGERLVPASRVGPVSAFEDKKPFVVAVEGDSMSEAGIRDGDEIVVNPAADVRGGDAALVCFGKNRDVAVKWVYFLPGGEVELRSATPGFPILRFTKDQQLTESEPLIIIGRVVSYTGEPKRG